MGSEVVNKNRNCVFNGPYAGRDQYIIMLEDTDREFVVTHNANIRPVSYFTGRETELQELRQRIEDGCKSVLVSGMGGIGKTHICRKLFQEYLKKYTKDGNELFHHIGYIEYDGDMGSSLQKCLKFKQQENPEQNLKAAWMELEYLASDGKLLLFVDNVNTSIESDPGLERLKYIPGAIILTSRQTSFSGEFEPYHIGFLSIEQCRQVYERIRFEDSGKKINEADVSILEYIIDKLAAKHTITVEFLAHLAQTKHWTVKRLRDELKKNGFRLEYKDEDDKLVNIQKSYETLYDLSVLTETEQNILEAFSVFPYIPLKVEICNQWLLADAGVSEDDDIVIGLYRKGWLQFDMEQESYSMHPVFASFIYNKSMPKEEDHYGLIEACRKYVEISQNGYNLKCREFLPFAEGIAEKLVDRQIGFLSTLSYSLYYVAEYHKAEKLGKKVLSLYKEANPSKAKDYDNLATVYVRQGKYREAEELYKKGLQIREKVFGKEHPDITLSYNALAWLYEHQGKYRKAEDLYKKCLQIREKVFGKESLEAAVIYNNLAWVYMRQSRYKEGEKLSTLGNL